MRYTCNLTVVGVSFYVLCCWRDFSCLTQAHLFSLLLLFILAQTSGKIAVNYWPFWMKLTEPTVRLSVEERRAATVQAVMDLAAEQNPSNITTAAIAKQMGLTQGAIFRHFPTKDAIFQAVMAWVAERLLARVDKAAQGITSPIAAPLINAIALFDVRLFR